MLPAVVVAGAALRVIAPTVLPHLTEALASTVEVSTPVDSWRSLQEAFFYLDHGIDVYDGSMVHHPPLFVAVMKALHDAVPAQYVNVLFALLFAAVDVGVAVKLVKLNEWYNTHHSNKVGRTLVPVSAGVIAAFYLFNPLVLLTNWAHSSLVFTYFLLVELLVQVLVDANVYRGAIALAVAAYLSVYPVFLVVPYLALAYAVAPKKDWTVQFMRALAVFVVSLAALLLISFALTALPDFLTQCYWSVLVFAKKTPNLGLWWYIFTEMFEFFTPLYQCIFNLYSFVFVLPLTLRFFEHASDRRLGDSFLAFFLSYLWLSFSKGYPIIGDLGFAISMAPIFANTVIPHAKFLSVTALTLITCLLLSPIFYYCWIVLGNGNSNFFYSMSLIWGGVHVLIFLDFIWGRLVFDFVEVNDVKDPAKLRLTQI